MAIITVSTYRSIIKSFYNNSRRITLSDFLTQVYDDERVFNLLNKYDLSYLLNYKNFLENPLSYQRQINLRTDTQTYVQEREKKHTYHLFNDCWLLNNDFLGFRIPEEIRERNLVEIYRNWFRDNNLIERYKEKEINADSIVYQFNTDFALKHSLRKWEASSNLVDEYNNTGNFEEIVHEFDLDLFRNELERSLLTIDKLKNTTSHSNYLIKHYHMGDKSQREIKDYFIQGFYFNTESLEDDKTIEFLYLFLNLSNKLSKRILKLLEEYFIWTYEASNNYFSRVTLENFNLQCCPECSKRDI